VANHLETLLGEVEALREGRRRDTVGAAAGRDVRGEVRVSGRQQGAERS
jgi:hypothetical protein